MMNTEMRTLERAPIVNDIVIIDPQARGLFDVVALDDIYGEMIYVREHATDKPAQWVFLTHVKVIDDESPNAWA
jgi:hypothetical protein